jgi:cell division protein FtsA
LEGTEELADEVFELPVRIGRPQDIGGLVDVVNSPIFATGVGLIKYGQRYRTEQQHHHNDDGKGGGMFSGIKRWLGG